ncbi:MAG: type II secretion system protein N, partial [Ramlibacter sp.]
MARTTPSSWPAAPWSWAAAGAMAGLALALLLFAPAHWLAGAVTSASAGHLVLNDPRGTVWSGSAQLMLTGGAGSRDAVALPGRLDWRLRPAWSGLRAEVVAGCCTTQPLALLATPRWGGGQLVLADGSSQWPAALLA